MTCSKLTRCADGHSTFLLAVAALLGVTRTTAQQPVVGSFGELAKAVVQVVAKGPNGNDIYGTGFRTSHGIVTALHVVGLNKSVDVIFTQLGRRTEKAQPIRYLDGLDLVLLGPADDEWPATPVLKISDSVARLGEMVRVVGFPLHAPQPSDSLLTVKLTKRPLREIIDTRVSDRLRGTTLNTSNQFLNMGGHLLPGHSGAPIINSQGRVIGVGLGGLEGGAASFSFGADRDALNSLFSASKSPPSKKSMTSTQDLFSADTRPGIQLGKEQFKRAGFIRVRKRTLGELLRSTESPKGALVLMQQFGVSQRIADSLLVDVWEHSSSGGFVVVPTGIELQPYKSEGVWRAMLPGRGELIAISWPCVSAVQAQAIALGVENQRFAPSPGSSWRVVPFYGELTRRDNGVSIRKALEKRGPVGVISIGYEVIAYQSGQFQSVILERAPVNPYNRSAVFLESMCVHLSGLPKPEAFKNAK